MPSGRYVTYNLRSMSTRTLLPDPSAPLGTEPEWPDVPDGRSVVLLVDAPSALERRIVEAWVHRHRPQGVQVDSLYLAPSRRRRPGDVTDPALGARLTRGDDPWVVPLRVIWRASERHGRRSASWIDVLKLGDPRDPDPVRQYAILWSDPDRVAIVMGQGAGAAVLRADHEQSVEVLGLVEFVTRRAHIALERAERMLRGNRYKVPRFLKQEILTRSEFRDGVLQVAAETGMPPELAFARARYYLGEIAATHSPFLIDLLANFIHWLYRQGYGAILYDPSAVADIARLGEEHPIVFLPSHRSNMDKLSLQFLLWENNLPPNHTAAGINMNFFPVGPLIRRTGSFFIRRSFKDNPLYKHVVRSYLDYLVERRFPLEWYMEGGRSRTGKLLPPRYGMLGWVVDAVQRGKADDLYLIPTSIAYDQIQDVADYATEASGGEKKKESFGWALEAARSLRRRYGNIHIRFAEPLSVAKEIPVGDEDHVSIELQKLAFEVMYRISRVTPFTPTAVVSIAVLSARGRPLDAEEVARRAAGIDEYVAKMQFPTTEPLRLEHPRAVQRVLDQLASHGSVTATKTGGGIQYSLDPGQALQAAYYRNVVLHYFVPGSIAEMALLAGGHGGSVEDVWRVTAQLRDLLKFEFFFPEREEFLRQVEEELEAIDEAWQEHVHDAEDLLARSSLTRAHWALLPLLEAYQIVADQLLESEDRADEKTFLDACLARGRIYRAEGWVSADESVSKAVFASARKLAQNRGLLEPDATVDRDLFVEEISRFRHLAETIAEIADSS